MKPDDPAPPPPVPDYHSPATPVPLYGLAVISRNLAWLSVPVLFVSLLMVMHADATWLAWVVIGIYVALCAMAIALARYCLNRVEQTPNKARAAARWATSLAILSLVLGGALHGLPALLGPPSPPPRPDTCDMNLRMIAVGIMMYASEHNGVLPAQLGDLFVGPYLEPRAFCCPLSTDTPAQGNTPAELAADFAKGGHLSYVYVGQGLTMKQLNSTIVLAFEPPGRHGQGKKAVRVLFGDGHVEVLDVVAAQKLLSTLPSATTPSAQ